MAKKIVIAIHKGGVGKTTTAKNLAAALATKNKRVLLVDLDQQANATTGMGINYNEVRYTINHLFINPELSPIDVILPTGIDNLHILPAHPDLAKTEAGMTLQATDPLNNPIYNFKGILETLEGSYDYIIIDTPPSLGHMTHNALAAADVLIIPAAASAYSEHGVSAMWGAFQSAQRVYNPNLKKAHILVTRVKRTNASSSVLDGLKEEHTSSILPQIIMESTSVDEAEQLGQTVVMYAPDSPASIGYKNVAEILINE